MPAWLVIIFGYLLGSIPTAYIFGHLFKKVDIRCVGDRNMGAKNAFLQLGPRIGVAVGLIDAAKGALAVLIAQGFDLSQPLVLITGAAAVVGHNWPVFIGFRGGRGASTTIGVLLVLVTVPMLILAVPAIISLVLTRSTNIANAVLFVPLPIVGWLLHVPGILIIYGIALPVLVGITHFLRTRPHHVAVEDC